MRLLLVCVLAVLGCSEREPSAVAPDASGPEAGTPDAQRLDAASADGAIELDASEPATPARCIEADTQQACEAIRLPPLVECSDCAHDCTWMPLYEVESASALQCSYGEAGGLCVYQSFGEDDGTDITRTCGGSDESPGGFWLDRTGERPRVGFAMNGSVTHPALESCAQGGDEFALALECHCPCQRGYPGEACTTTQQQAPSEPRVSNGLEYCPGVPTHRLEAVTCVAEEGCATDADCADGEACVCGIYRAPSTCVPSTCATDADCEGEEVCAVSYDDALQPEALACRAPYAECDGVTCASTERCVVELETGEWRCVLSLAP